MIEIPYATRDGRGNDIIKNVKIKEFPIVKKNFICKACGKECTEGHETKKCVSSKFTDWAYVGEYICCDCAKLLSLYFYNYSVENGKIKLFNVREIKDNILRPHTPPFKIIISTSQKKHLFYRAPTNYTDNQFGVQLENETVYTTQERMKELFDFVECMQTLGTSKISMAEGRINYETLKEPFGRAALKFLNDELLKSREIQIPLYCGQKREISEEEAKCYIISILEI